MVQHPTKMPSLPAGQTTLWDMNEDGTRLDRTNGTVVFADGRTLPLYVIVEPRNGAYASVRPSGVRIRIPAAARPAEQSKLLAQMEKWVLENVPNEAPQNLPDYYDGQQLTVRNRTYRLKIQTGKGKEGSGRLEGRTIHLRLPPRLKSKGRRDRAAVLLSRIIGADFSEEIDSQVRTVLKANEHLLRKPNGQKVQVAAVRLKNTVSRWGSCSYAGNINLSTRLLLGPVRHMDYVIVHELAHLVEDNHSHRFWNLVAAIDPAYKESERWLSENGHTLIW